MTSAIYPENRHNPYYIVAPPYVRTSAGIRALHLLGHALNKKGFNAFMTSARLNPDFLTKPLTLDIIDHHYENKITPIVIYPETVKGNPYGAPFVVRYIMNFPGLLGGDKSYPKSEMCFGYSKELLEGQKAEDQSNVLYIPGCDTATFHPPHENTPRKGSCYFASKFKNVHNGKTFPVTNDSFEITRDLPDSLSPQEIAELLRKSEVFYAYENTALATEATLCGCPAVFLPNSHLTKRIATEESGTHGVAWGSDPKEVERAKETVHLAYQDYLKQIDLFWTRLDQFIELTQNAVKKKDYPERIVKARLKQDSDLVGSSDFEKPKLVTTRQKFYGALSVMVRLAEEDGVVGLIRKVIKALRQGGIPTVIKRAHGIYFRK